MSFHSRATFVLSAVAILGLVLVASQARADCDPENTIFEDDFEFLDGSWTQPTDKIYVEDGVLVLKDWGQVNRQAWSDAADVCLDAMIVEAPDPSNSSAWIFFWWEDWNNYYALAYWVDGHFEVRRLVKGKDLTVVYAETSVLKKGFGETNHIELRLRPKDGTVFINGTEATRFKGKPPKDGGAVGLGGWSPDDKPITVKFDNLVVSEPAE